MSNKFTDYETLSLRLQCAILDAVNFMMRGDKNTELRGEDLSAHFEFSNQVIGSTLDMLNGTDDSKNACLPQSEDSFTELGN